MSALDALDALRALALPHASAHAREEGRRVMLRPSCDPGERADNRHRFCELYKLRCDCDRCITPRARAEKEALARALRPRGDR